MSDIIYPRAVRPGDQICIIDPANAFTQEGVDAAIQYFESRGLKVVISEDMAFRRGVVSERAEKLNRVIRDPKNRGIFCMWGGYGTMSLLDYIDYKALEENRPAFAGMSDITAIHLAIAKRTKLVTFHSPPLYSAKRPVTPDAKESLIDAVMNPEGEKEFYNLNGEKFEVLQGGSFGGRLVGGNLTLVCRLMGTPYEIDTRDKVLFLEEIGEKPYRLHGMLTQLQMAGKLDAAAGIIIGALTDCDNPGRCGSGWEHMRWVLEQVKVPVIYNVRAGHICDPFTLPLNAQIEVSVRDAVRIRKCERRTVR